MKIDIKSDPAGPNEDPVRTRRTPTRPRKEGDVGHKKSITRSGNSKASPAIIAQQTNAASSLILPGIAGKPATPNDLLRPGHERPPV